MARKKLIRTNDFPYHITARSNNREWFQLPLHEVWNIFCLNLAKQEKKNELKIYQFILMNNHYHLLAGTPRCNIDIIMADFQKSVANEINRKTIKVNHVFGGPYKWTIINNEKYLKNVIRYVYQNPLRAKLVNRAQEYSFSTCYYRANSLSLPFKISLKELIDLSSNEIFLNFINSQFNEEQLTKIKCALKKTEFKISQSQKNGRNPFALHTE